MTMTKTPPVNTASHSAVSERDVSPVVSHVAGDQHVARRAIVAVGLFAIVLLHALDLPGKLAELPYVGWMFIGLIIASLVVAEGLMRMDDRRLWLAAGLLAASAFIGYAISRTVGLPGDLGGDKGNWIEPLGLASLVVEGIVVLLVLGRLTSRRS